GGRHGLAAEQHPGGDRGHRRDRWRAGEEAGGSEEKEEALDRHYRLAVELQLLDRLEDVGERLVLALLRERLQLRLPALHQLLQRGDVEVAVMEVRLEARHPAREEAAVLADRVAAHRRGGRGHVRREERDGLALGGGLVQAGG